MDPGETARTSGDGKAGGVSDRGTLKLGADSRRLSIPGLRGCNGPDVSALLVEIAAVGACIHVNTRGASDRAVEDMIIKTDGSYF